MKNNRYILVIFLVVVLFCVSCGKASDTAKDSVVQLENNDNFDTKNNENSKKQYVFINSNIHFKYIDITEDKEMERILNKSFHDINEKFKLNFEEEIQVIVYPNQKIFWANVFPKNENNQKTTGFANHLENIIHLTSPNDTSIKTKEEMLKVPTHELVHILIPHSWIDIREGIAVYLANQIKPFNKKDIPSNLSTIITYKGTSDEISQSYSFAGLKIKFIIEECLENDYQKFLKLIENPNKEIDFSLLDFQNEGEFLNAFCSYLQK